MSSCESHEIRLSAWLDTDIEREERLEVVDHLVRCAGCRRFWAEARALDGFLAVARHDREPTAPPAELWGRIRAGANEPRRFARRTGVVPGWALRAAASLVLAAGLSLALIGFGGAGGDPGTSPDITLGAGAMDRTRFVSLTRELLQADPVYHEAMHRVMDEVLRDSRAAETSSEGFGPRIDVRGERDSTTTDRAPA